MNRNSVFWKDRSDFDCVERTLLSAAFDLLSRHQIALTETAKYISMLIDM
jgi:hypothetical protein